MIVVADTGPIRYPIVIGVIDVLHLLYDAVVIPQTVANELRQDSAPESVQAWLACLPDWFDIRPDPPLDSELAFLDPGEQAAIALALSIGTKRVLIDDWEGRVEAERRHLLVTRTLGVLADAHRAGLLDFEVASCCPTNNWTIPTERKAA
jgi:predicted nucleic acid-binding protein